MPDNDWRDLEGLGLSDWYDQEGDTVYISFNTGEPSYCVETDDILLIEVGIFSHRPTGFRAMNFSKPGSRERALETARALAAVSHKMRERQTAELEHALKKLIPA